MNTAQELDTELNERVFHQQLRIVRQRELVAKLEQRDDSAAVLDRSRSVLAGLELSLADLLVARATPAETKAPNRGLLLCDPKRRIPLSAPDLKFEVGRAAIHQVNGPPVPSSATSGVFLI
jgi:hypothetical protein